MLPFAAYMVVTAPLLHTNVVGRVIATASWTVAASVFARVLVASPGRRARLRVRETVLDRLPLADAANILDIGCGRGFVLNAAARRLVTGRAFGLDLWSDPADPDATLGVSALRRAGVAMEEIRGWGISKRSVVAVIGRIPPVS